MRYLSAWAGVLFLVIFAACGGDDPSVVHPAAPSDSSTTPAQSENSRPGAPTAPGQSANAGAAAPAGQIVLDVDGKTFTSEIVSCMFETNGSFAITPEGPAGVSVGVSAGKLTESLWSIQAFVSQDGNSVYAANSAGGAVPTVNGKSVELTIDFARIESSGAVNVGAGHLRATCP